MDYRRISEKTLESFDVFPIGLFHAQTLISVMEPELLHSTFKSPHYLISTPRGGGRVGLLQKLYTDTFPAIHFAISCRPSFLILSRIHRIYL
jgi:hypothetical protein